MLVTVQAGSNDRGAAQGSGKPMREAWLRMPANARQIDTQEVIRPATSAMLASPRLGL